MIEPLCGNSSVLLLGHRGARRCAPENSLAAFELALTHGCHGFEFDVRITVDRRAVICHDPYLGGLAVSDTTYKELAARHPVLTTLDEVLSRFATRAYLYIELKVAGIEDLLVSALAANPPVHGYVVASFLPEVLEKVAAIDSRIPLGLICSNQGERSQWRRLPIRILMPQLSLITDELTKELHAQGKQIFAWTANQEKEMRDLAALNVDGIVSDDTELLCRVLGGLGPADRS